MKQKVIISKIESNKSGDAITLIDVRGNTINSWLIKRDSDNTSEEQIRMIEDTNHFEIINKRLITT